MAGKTGAWCPQIAHVAMNRFIKHHLLVQQGDEHGRFRVPRTRIFGSKDTRRLHHEQSTRPIRLRSRIVGMDCSLKVLQGGLVVDPCDQFAW